MKDQGSVYRAKQHQLKLMKNYGELPFLTKSERSFLLDLMELLLVELSDNPELEEISVSRSRLSLWLKSKGVGSSLTLIKKRSQAITDYGLFAKSTSARPGRKPYDIFILSELRDVINNAAPAKEVYEDFRPHIGKLSEIKNQLVIADAQILDRNLPVHYARSERLWNGVLGSCMRSSNSDSRGSDPFTTIYRFGPDTIEIITSAQSDSETAHINDQRTIRTIMTLVHLAIQERREIGAEIKNEFFVDIVDLCNLMELDGSGANRDTVRKSMERLYSTNFHIKLDSTSAAGQQFVDFFGFSVGADDFNFRFLTEMDSSLDRKYGGGAVRRPRWYRISLHSKTFQDLVDTETISTFIDNKELLGLSSGMLHLLYSWCTWNVKRAGNRKAVATMRRLQRQLIPASRYDTFLARLLNQLKRYTLSKGKLWDDHEPNSINLFGYKVKIIPDEANDFIVEAWRDKKDPVIGDNSLHNRQLRARSGAAGKEQVELEF